VRTLSCRFAARIVVAARNRTAFGFGLLVLGITSLVPTESLGQTEPRLRPGDLVRIEGAVAAGQDLVTRREAKGALASMTGDSAIVKTESGELLHFSLRDVERLKVYAGKRVHLERAIWTVPAGALLGTIAGGLLHAKDPCDSLGENPAHCFVPGAERDDSIGQALAIGAVVGAVTGFLVALMPVDHWEDVDRSGLALRASGGRLFLSIRIGGY